MRRIIIVLVIAAMSITTNLADVPIEGITQYTYQYVINNTADYPDYVFLTSSEIWGFEHPSLVINGTFGGGYKLDGFILHAMKDTDLDTTVKEKISSADQGDTNVTAYFTSIPLATSDILLPISSGMDETIPLSNITVLLQVEEIRGNELNVTKVKTVLGFENGTIQEEMNSGEDDTAITGDVDPDLLHLV